MSHADQSHDDGDFSRSNEPGQGTAQLSQSIALVDRAAASNDLPLAQVLRAGELAVWLDYRKKRDITSHTYDEQKGREVYQSATHFVEDAGGFSRRAEARGRVADVISGVELRPSDRDTVAAILRTDLPANAQVWVFGSRAKDRARRGSDLDLLVEAGRPLTTSESAELNYAFEESDLPWRVDVVDWRPIQADFRARINKDRFPFTETVA